MMGGARKEEFMIKREKVWIRLAGNAKHIKAGGKEGWRCFISETPIDIPSADDEIRLIDWKLYGPVSMANFIPGTFKASESGEIPMLVAWIDMFGNIQIQDEVATIEVLNPEK
jgi:hypothetical protein